MNSSGSQGLSRPVHFLMTRPSRGCVHKGALASRRSQKERTMVKNVLYGGLPNPLWFAAIAFVQFHAVRAFA
jgi:hypothetical protein